MHLNVTIFYRYKIPLLWGPIREPQNESNKILTLNCYIFSPTLQRLRSDVWQVFKPFQYGGKTFHLWLNLYFFTTAVYRKRNFISAKLGFLFFNFWFMRYSPLNCKIRDFTTYSDIIYSSHLVITYSAYWKLGDIAVATTYIISLDWFIRKHNERKPPNIFIAVNTERSPIERHRLHLEALYLLYDKTS